MKKDELWQYICRLDTSNDEVAQLLGVTPRTMRRWLEGEEIPAPAQQAILAWVKLHENRLPWKPDSNSILLNDQQQIQAHLANSIELAALMESVEARGGPKLSPWEINLDRGYAIFGPMRISFYNLHNGGFSLSYFSRKDSYPDLARDKEIIEDAAYCIALHIKKSRQIEPARRDAAHAALADLGQYIRSNSEMFVRNGPEMPLPSAVSQKKAQIELQADKLLALADNAKHGDASYQEFEEILGALHRYGFFPPGASVSRAASVLLTSS